MRSQNLTYEQLQSRFDELGKQLASSFGAIQQQPSADEYVKFGNIFLDYEDTANALLLACQDRSAHSPEAQAIYEEPLQLLQAQVKNTAALRESLKAKIPLLATVL